MDDVRVTVSAKTMEGKPAADPQMTLTVSEALPFQRVLAKQNFDDFDTQATLSMQADLGANPQWMAQPDFARFAMPDGAFFRPVTQADFVMNVALVRVPSRWNARFTPYAGLASPRFDALKAIAAVSTNVDFKVPGLNPIANLADGYDAIDGEPQRLAKTALLNLFAGLIDGSDPVGTGSWFRYVKKIVRLDQERFIAEVDPQMFTSVKTIVDGLGVQFDRRVYSTETAADFPLHYPNIPASYGCPQNLAVPMVTLKIAYEQGDVQLTMTSYKSGVVLLDCDMDENLALLAHTVDLAAHALEELEHAEDAGTHPFLMHEYIVRDSAQQAPDGVSTIDLGYELV